ncbi:hypothetical protein LCGC14_3037560 [marine sediment metagenome]|uniref:Uncharacterized protein n=1 Tax=marine sediment metagenome TaxID=412755 RepID=A0A0F8ZGI2_9ZZZZ
MTDGLKATHGVIMREVSGVLAIADRPLPLFGLERHRRAIIHIMQEANLALGAGDEVRFLLETAYGAGPFVASGELLDEAADINDSQSSFTVDDTTTFVVGDVIRLDVERMLVTALDGAGPGVLTVERAFGGDAPAAHVNNVAIFLQDVDWVTVSNIMYDNTDNGTAPEAVVVIGSTSITPVIADDLDAALADNTILALPLGDRLRLRTTIANTPSYRYSARASFQN